jgi:hypothetical protein
LGGTFETKEGICSRHLHQVSIGIMVEGIMMNIYVQNESARESK